MIPLSPHSSLEERERSAILAAAYALPDHKMMHGRTADPEENQFFLLAPEERIVARMTVNSGGDPWAMIAIPLAEEPSLNECLFVYRGHKVGFIHDLQGFDPNERIEFDETPNLLHRIWNELPPSLQQLAGETAPPHPKLVWCALCFIADASRNVWDIEVDDPISSEARRRRIMKNLAQNGLPRPNGE